MNLLDDAYIIRTERKKRWAGAGTHEVVNCYNCS